MTLFLVAIFFITCHKSSYTSINTRRLTEQVTSSIHVHTTFIEIEKVVKFTIANTHNSLN